MGGARRFGKLFGRLVVLACALLALAPSSSWATTKPAQSTAYQLDAAHDGYLPSLSLSTPLHHAWSRSFGGTLTYPLSADGLVFLTAPVSSQGGGSELYALSLSTGHIQWSHLLGGDGWSGVAYDSGRVFAVTDGGVLTAFTASSGHLDWSAQLPDQYDFSSAPTAVHGIVYDSGAGDGGNLYANSESTGTLLWTDLVANGDSSSPAVGSQDVYVTYPDNYYAFNRSTGKTAWVDALGGDGGGGRTPVVAAGHVFVRDPIASARILSASSGAMQGPLGSTTAPAVGGGTGYELAGSTLVAVGSSGLGNQRWSFAGDGHLDTAPIILGSIVWIGSSSGRLYGISTSGPSHGVWHTKLAHPIDGPSGGGDEILAGLGAGAGTLLVPAGSTLVAYR